MANSSISRRAILPGMAAGAAALALSEAPATAAATRARRVVFQAGPAAMVRGQTLTTAVFLPAVQDANLPAVQFQLTLHTLQGQAIGTTSLSIAPGQGGVVVLQGFADGSVRLQDQPVNLTIAAGEQVQVLGILIGLLLPAVQMPAATLQCSNNLRNSDQLDAGFGPVTYALPFAPGGIFSHG